MKFKLLLISFLGGIFLANAQFTVVDGDGNVLNEGAVLVVESLIYPENEVELIVHNNNPDEEIYVNLECVDAENSTTGHFDQMCFGICIFAAEVGDKAPGYNETVAIPAGGSTQIGNYLLNTDPGDGQGNVTFSFTFRQYEDAMGTTETGESLTFSYSYRPSLGIDDPAAVGTILHSTVVSGQLKLTVSEPVEMTIFNLQGQRVKQLVFEAGLQTADLSDLSSQPYLVQFKNEKGSVKTTKIVVK